MRSVKQLINALSPILLASILLWPFFLGIYAYFDLTLGSMSLNNHGAYLGYASLFHKAVEPLILTLILLTLNTKRKWLMGLLNSVYLVILSIYSLQYLAVYFSGSSINLLVLNSVNEAHLFVNQFTLSVVIIPLAIQVILLFISMRYLNLFSASKKNRIIGGLLALTLLGSYFVISDDSTVRRFARTANINMGFPVINLAKNVCQYFNAPSLASSLPVIDNAEKEIARHYGVKFYGEEKNRMTTYTHASAFIDEKQTKQPNVIIIFAESLSANLLNVYSPREFNNSPNIEKFSHESMLVTDYYNHAFPTLNGLRGQLCSSFSNLGSFPGSNIRMVDQLNDKSFQYCLPTLLSNSGYDTTYLTHSARNKFEIQQLIKQLNFDKTFFNFDTAQTLLKLNNPESVDDLSDTQVMKSLWTLATQKAKEEKPFFIAVSTIQTHGGFPLSKENDFFAHPVNSPQDLTSMENKVFNFDHAFGEFWEAFMHSPLKENTIVILTGDHVLPASNESFEATQEKPNSYKSFDKLALIIYDPTNKLHGTYSANATSLDLAPSIMQMIGEKDHENQFQGYSLFSDRPEIGGAASIISKSLLTINKGNIERTQQPCEQDQHCELYNALKFIDVSTLQKAIEN